MTVAWPVAGEHGITEPAEYVAAQARQAVGFTSGRLSVRRVCEAAGVKVLCRPLAVGQRRHTAMLVPTHDGFSVVVDPLLWERAADATAARRRLRFVVAHELGHTVFYRPGRPPSRIDPVDKREERFCHRFATALLLPAEAAREARLDPQGLYSLAASYDVSVRVAAWALVRALPHLTVLWMTQAAHPVRGDSETMRVQWAASERFVPFGESFKSPLAELSPGDHAHSYERLRLGGREDEVSVMAWRFAGSMLVITQPRMDEAKELGGGQFGLF